MYIYRHSNIYLYVLTNILQEIFSIAMHMCTKANKAHSVSQCNHNNVENDKTIIKTGWCRCVYLCVHICMC